MNRTEVFQVLGIEETKEEAAIKKAYREKLTVTNPEDNPEGFKRLRTAYEEACVYARTNEETEKEEEDITPTGQWVKKAAEIYARIDTRQNIELWSALFEEDIFLSLEEEENCRRKLLCFLMECFKLPTAVWRLLDEKLHITEDAAGLKESFPGDFVNYIVSRCRQGEDLAFDQFEGAADADYDLFIQYSNNSWEALNSDRLKEAEEFIQNADALEIYHPVMELNRAWLWEKQGKADEAVQWVERLWKRYPHDVMIGYQLGEMLWKNDRKDRAAEVFEAIRGINEKHYMANARLTRWYYEKGRYQEAKKCAEEILRVGVDDEFRQLLFRINHELEKDMEKSYRENPDYELGLELGWCYLQDCKYSRGIALCREIENCITEEKKSEYRGLLTKLYAEGAEYEAGIMQAEAWEEALRERLSGELEEEDREKDQDRLKQSYALRAYCYHQLGYKDAENFKKAIEQIERIEKKEEPDINLMMEKARIYLEMEELDKCLEVTRTLIEDHQIYAAYATEQEVYRKMWNAEGVLQAGFHCIHFFPDYVRPYERIAKVYADLQYREDLEKLLKEAKEQKLDSVYLEAYAYGMNQEIPDNKVLEKKLEEFRKEYLAKVEEGRLEYYEKGLPIITEYLYWCPGPYMLVERALFHRAACEYDKAMEDFDKALEEEPGNPYAWNGLAYVYKMKGDYEQALVCAKKAVYYFEEEYTRSFSNMGDLYSLLGIHKEALRSYEQVLRIGGERIRDSEYYMRRYAIVLARNGQPKEAVKVLEGAYGNHFERLKEQSEIYQLIGDKENAEKYLEEWSRLLQKSKRVAGKLDYAEFYNNMAWQELIFGEGKKALEYFEKQIQNRGNSNNVAGSYCDMIFACILWGDEERGRLYAQKLCQWQEKEKAEGRNDYYESDKGRLQLEFLARFYTASNEELEEMLAKEAHTSICVYCTHCICKEMEAVRVLYLLRTGKEKEASECLRVWQEKMPFDEYLRAILHRCEAVFNR